MTQERFQEFHTSYAYIKCQTFKRDIYAVCIWSAQDMLCSQSRMKQWAYCYKTPNVLEDELYSNCL